jgi:peptidoglycan/xylan/chitin deacetylase (PgdA/CDA1 family)
MINSTMIRTVVNLTVHGIGTPPPERELEPGEDQIWISVAQFELMLDAVVDRPDVRITFDDANVSDLEIGLPRLVDRGLDAQFFLLAGRLGEPGRLDEEGVRALCAAGMSIGSHGWAHQDWRQLGDTVAEREIRDACDRLTDLCGTPVTDVSVPFGSYDRTVLRRLRSAGVRQVFTSDGGPADSTAWLQARTSLHNDMTAASLERILAPPGFAESATRTLKRTVKRWR